MKRRKILVVVGTRPEAIKMAPVIRALKQCEQFTCLVVATAQHRELMDQALQEFGIEPDLDLDMMRPNQSLATLTSRLLTDFEQALMELRPDAVLAQGDTTTVLAVALSCFYQRIPFGHVEAGLRTGDMSTPFPEELNRVLASRIAKWHFAPTLKARGNLLGEGVAEQDIHLTGNTVIDALLHSLEHRKEPAATAHRSERLLLVTLHRRESFGAPLRGICSAIRGLVERNSDIHVLFPVHPNPNVKTPVEAELGGHPRIELCAPLSYHRFIAAMQAAYLVLSDSGGVQEEAPALGTPVLVLRNETERQEAIEHGMVKLVGTAPEAITHATQSLLDDPSAYAGMIKEASPYGDGQAAGRIVQVLKEHFSTCA
ncbi:UDP-N-acetylglucosamine 2-epimerase (non-hydrolyzing) [Pseudomonas tohonis]|nr:hypothetical protein L682_10070 [Pseudomonas alcaligenes OT 69]MDN4144558.1 UDP-N-acetylglucosamine 2-epimerase (non-hydrolyzing) [Pseudomonas tohonis]